MLHFSGCNIERSKHLHRVEAFLTTHVADVFCAQEVCQRDLPWLENLFGQKAIFVPQRLHAAEVELEPMGIALISRRPLHDVEIVNVDGSPLGDAFVDEHQHRERMIFATVRDAAGAPYRVGTTHFAVTEDGQVTQQQMASVRHVLDRVADQTAHHGGVILTGDFNAPRGREAFDTLAATLTDAIPPEHDSSLDPVLHTRAGTKPQRMVDGLFHTPDYRLEYVRLHQGISDHKAITALVYYA